jgi:invasion protein IalB
MNRMLIMIASVAIVAAAGIGLAAGFLSTDDPSTTAPAARADQAMAAVSDDLKTGVAPGSQSAAGPVVKLAQEQPAAKQAKPTQYGLWVFSCADAPAGEPQKCAARLAIRDNKRNVTVINWLIGHNKDKELLMEIITPVDVLIGPGLQLGIGEGAAQSFPYLSCTADGCLTRLRPDAQFLDALRQAEIVKLTIATPAGKSLTFSIKVTGLAESLDALAKL